MSESRVVMSSRVRLARNYEDLPFDTASRIPDADECVARTSRALARSGVDAGFELVRLADLSEILQREMAESRLISRDLLREPRTAAVLVNRAEMTSIMMNEEDHLRIQAIRPGLNLDAAAESCFRVERALGRQVRFAFDQQLGYLTACPTNTGTGMRASLLLHLPMLTRHKRMGDVGQIVAKVGLTIHGVFGEGSEALGQVYQISNQVTLGRTEQELIAAVTAVGKQLTDMETALRERALQEARLPLMDGIGRAWGILRHARQMDMVEFLRRWSEIRLGSAMGVLDVPASLLDELLLVVQEAHLLNPEGNPVEGETIEEARASCVRRALRGGVETGV